MWKYKQYTECCHLLTKVNLLLKKSLPFMAAVLINIIPKDGPHSSSKTKKCHHPNNMKIHLGLVLIGFP